MGKSEVDPQMTEYSQKPATFRVIISRKILKYVSFFYERLFHEPAGEEVINFVRNLSYIGVGTLLSSLFSFSYNIIAGRVLGPSGYGNFTLVQSIAMILYIPMLLGLNVAMIKYTAESRDQHNQEKIISTTFILVSCLTLGSVLLFSVFQYQLAVLFSVDHEIFVLAVLFSLLFVFYTLATSGLRGLHLMKDYGKIQPLFGFALLSSLLILFMLQFTSYKAMVYSTYLAYFLVGAAVIVIFLKKYLTIYFDRSWFSTLWRYSSLAVIGGLSFTLYANIDRILINYFLDVESVGIYGVYYYAAFTMLTLISGIFTTVFFSASSQSQDKESIYKKLNKSVPFMLLFGFPIAFVGEYIILLLFGKGYPISLPLMLVFAVAAVLVTWYGVYAWFFNSEGIEGSKLTVSGTLLIAIANIILNIILIPRIGLYGAIGATALAFSLGLAYNYYRGKDFFTNDHPLNDV